MLRSVDVAVAYYAAMLDHQEEGWSAAQIRKDLGIPRATLSESIGRLSAARLVHGPFINRAVLASLLPVLPNLFPASPSTNEPVAGVPTGYSTPAFGGLFVASLPQVWALAGAPTKGVPIQPLHPALPRSVARPGHPRRHALLGFLDAIRGGRAREVAHGAEGVKLLCGLPQSPGLFARPAISSRMAEAVSALSGSSTGTADAG